jgi:hypothetical protein
MEEVWQGVRRKIAEPFGTIESVVQPLGAPPSMLQRIDGGKWYVVDHSRLHGLQRDFGQASSAGRFGEHLWVGLDEFHWKKKRNMKVPTRKYIA